MAALECLFATASAAITRGTATMNNFTAASFLSPDRPGPWAIYLAQIARARPALGELAGLAETPSVRNASSLSMCRSAWIAAKQRNIALASSRCAIQGFGNVGFEAARLFDQHGCLYRRL